MRKNILAIVFMTVALALSGYGQTDSPFVSKDGKFTVIPPTGFDRSKFEKQTSSSGDMTINQYEIDLERGTCMIVYFDLPDNVVKTKSTQKILEDGRDGAVHNAGATLDSQESFTIDGYPALTFNSHTVNDKTIVFARTVAVIANSRAYTFLYLSIDKAELTKPDVLKFFTSIHIQK